ncbi:hypothetical protein LdCL_290023000 [Leishmania donovani]|uniref:Uncharacterized protein n=1 Tax=Leishmania donovani TaxID=5661 RepID=A0A3S5H7L4_LEIDO|nr:hypothetical protein LdCL_290023000 [Leishmania donovani]
MRARYAQYCLRTVRFFTAPYDTPPPPHRRTYAHTACACGVAWDCATRLRDWNHCSLRLVFAAHLVGAHLRFVAPRQRLTVFCSRACVCALFVAAVCAAPAFRTAVAVLPFHDALSLSPCVCVPRAPLQVFAPFLDVLRERSRWHIGAHACRSLSGEKD